ncbi:unnamed protein product [Amoebophrya sp. A25]|nr:unnamed protein product [Amoebophrya sp. A25]|eukprot:GSA25T00010614001.1
MRTLKVQLRDRVRALAEEGVRNDNLSHLVERAGESAEMITGKELLSGDYKDDQHSEEPHSATGEKSSPSVKLGHGGRFVKTPGGKLDYIIEGPAGGLSGALTTGNMNI